MDERTLRRFTAKLRIEEGDGCWLWTGSLDGSGYGMLHTSDGTRRAHRLAYEHHVGPIPDGLQLDHLCRVRHCVRPEHLEPVTPRENTDRGLGRVGRPRVDACRHGHPYTPENTMTHSNGKRSCRVCKRAAFDRWYEKKAGNE